jgi:hypothetical protein
VLFLLGEKLDDKVFDGEPVGKLVYGVGGIHAVRSDRVRRVATTAASLSREEARARFDPKTMSETGIHELMGDEDEDFDSAWDKLCELREAWGRAAERNLGMLVVFD